MRVCVSVHICKITGEEMSLFKTKLDSLQCLSHGWENFFKENVSSPESRAKVYMSFVFFGRYVGM